MVRFERSGINKEKKSESNFLVQGSILAVASIISRVIGLLYRIPLRDCYGNLQHPAADFLL